MNQEEERILDLQPIETTAKPIIRQVTPAELLAHIKEYAEIADEYMECEERIIESAIAKTDDSQWIDYNGEPFPTAAACERIRRFLGLSIKAASAIDIQLMNDDKGEFKVFTQTYFAINKRGDEFYATGVVSTREPFFNRKDPTTGKIIFLPLSEINIPNAMMKTNTRAESRVIKKALGINDITWERLHSIFEKRNKKFDPKKKIQFKSKSQKSSSQKKSESSVEEEKLSLEEMILDMQRMLEEMHEGDKAKIEAALKKFSSFGDFPGVETTAKLTEKSIPVVYYKIKSAWNFWNAGEGA